MNREQLGPYGFGAVVFACVTLLAIVCATTFGNLKSREIKLKEDALEIEREKVRPRKLWEKDREDTK